MSRQEQIERVAGFISYGTIVIRKKIATELVDAGIGDSERFRIGAMQVETEAKHPARPNYFTAHYVQPIDYEEEEDE